MSGIDVVVLTWNDPPGMLDAAVESALSSVGVEVRVTVVDNGSDPPATAIADPRVRHERRPRNLGVSGGRNVGVRLGDQRMVCLLDSDAVLAPHSLAVMSAALDDPSIGVVVPVFRGQRPEESAGRAPTLRVKLDRGLGRRNDYEALSRTAGDRRWDVEFGIGACQLFERATFDDVGGLDECIFYGPEDVDFCLRVRAAGKRVVQVDGADVFHPPRRAFRQPFSQRGLEHGLSILRHLWRHRKKSSPD